MKTVRLSITVSEVIEAQGGGPVHDLSPVWVEIPDGYDPELIVAADIVHDPNIRLAEPTDD